MARLAVLGAAESGVGTAILAQQKGYEVFISDMGNIKEKYKNLLDAHGLSWEEGRHTESEILNADEIVKSPGIPDTAPIVAEAYRRGIPVISEIEFAARYTHAKMLCITGSNGKTTTTSLIYHILKTAGFNVGLGGNIGKSLALQVAEGERDWYVIELSSFQLDNMYKFCADIAVLLNITPDHLDRYDFCMKNYVDSKLRILQNQRAEDTFIYWAGDAWIGKELPNHKVGSHVCAFSDTKEETLGSTAAYSENGKLMINIPQHFEMPLHELSLPGRHNLRNCMAAAIATLSAGVSPEVLRQCLSDFPGVEHRLEKVCTAGGVTYINDSKATNVDACYCALESMTAPVVLIVGGKDKGNDYAPLRPLISRKCRAIVYLGADNSKLHHSFDDLGLPVADTDSMQACVEACASLAHPGDVVLLSPCCASFDLFKNMEDRGEQFKTLAHQLPK